MDRDGRLPDKQLFFSLNEKGEQDNEHTLY